MKLRRQQAATVAEDEARLDASRQELAKTDKTLETLGMEILPGMEAGISTATTAPSLSAQPAWAVQRFALPVTAGDAVIENGRLRKRVEELEKQLGQGTGE